jgi:hypothetical protein
MLLHACALLLTCIQQQPTAPPLFNHTSNVCIGLIKLASHAHVPSC